MPNSQREEVIRYMREHGSITALEAAKALNVTQLSARISESERKGYVINRERISGTTVYGRPWKGYRYSIDEKATRMNIYLSRNLSPSQHKEAMAAGGVNVDDLAVMP